MTNIHDAIAAAGPVAFVLIVVYVLHMVTRIETATRARYAMHDGDDQPWFKG